MASSNKKNGGITTVALCLLFDLSGQCAHRPALAFAKVS